MKRSLIFALLDSRRGADVDRGGVDNGGNAGNPRRRGQDPHAGRAQEGFAHRANVWVHTHHQCRAINYRNAANVGSHGARNGGTNIGGDRSTDRTGFGRGC